MLPIKVMGRGMGGGPAVDFLDIIGLGTAPSPADAVCNYIVDVLNVTMTGHSTQQWRYRGAAADYQVFAHITSGPGAGGDTIGSSAFDTWLGAATGPGWFCNRTSNLVNVNTLVLAMQCRRVSDSVVIDTWTAILQAEVT